MESLIVIYSSSVRSGSAFSSSLTSACSASGSIVSGVASGVSGSSTMGWDSSAGVSLFSASAISAPEPLCESSSRRAAANSDSCLAISASSAA